ncbi:MAG: acyl-CoA dehydratase activase [Halanaerobiales bacterium]
MTAVGICMGASNISVVSTGEDKDGKVNVREHFSRAHEGNVRKTLKNMVGDKRWEDDTLFAVTGRKFKNLVDLPTIAEPEATELAYEHLSESYGEVDAIVSAGGETFIVYELDDKGKIANVYTGNKCASGTGEFFLQQIKRMNLTVDEALQIAKADEPYHISGRCSVFAKSDCTHALNKGEDKGKIVAGLCRMMADKIFELLTRFNPDSIMLVGGTSRNNIMVKYLRQRLKKVIVPEEATYFEALGTALWARKFGEKLTELDDLFFGGKSSFEFLPALSEYEDKVTFHSMEKDEAKDGDRCLLGIDVGSTTTKAVIIRMEDNALLASVYLRTKGDPVGAARECYQSLRDDIGDTDIEFVGLGVTGSGRQIVGLHALTDAVFNEIIAHAKAAVYFDPEVDTIFEIGGQDAKYTYLVNGVPTDYAMNEACSAGTGSFLEEAASESLNIEMTEIEDYALKGDNPPNFNDQCSAFISSDIKSAVQEGIGLADISAGLVYSICLNYDNRVKGNRPVGDKVFMQGGVCYNRAVPVAMAALTGKNIVVPPEPGLMGAFGVALVLKQHIELGLMEEKSFSLAELADREITYHEPFTCGGGKENCDMQCTINVMEINGEKYPFGGACNRYVNLSRDVEYDIGSLDLVRQREKMVFDEFFEKPKKVKGTVGINRSLTVSSMLPLYSTFFAELGYKVILPDEAREEGKEKEAAAFCYPVELSHGYMYDLLFEKDTDYIFLPHVRGLHVENSPDNSVLCPMAQGEPYYLQAIWPELKEDNVFTPILDFKDGYKEVEDKFVEMGRKLGISARKSRSAYKKAVEKQLSFKESLREKGEEVLEYLRKNPEEKAIVLFGRPYNAFVSDANMGIPHKFASRGELIIPYDMLPLEEEKVKSSMYWSMGQMIMKGTNLISEHPSLFGVYITNFSCGPDSFLINYFRDENGRKPSLTLELDSHTADAGLNTRIEAFLDVVKSYRQLQKDEAAPVKEDTDFKQARIEYGDNVKVYDSDGKEYSLGDERVKVLVPSMGGTATRAFVAAMNYSGINASVCPPPSEEELKLGRANSTSKECLPLQLTLGSLLKYLNNRDNEDELLVYFMPEASGPCRFGQYNVLINQVIKNRKIEDVVLLTLTASNGYAGMGRTFTIRAWQSVLVADVMDDIYSALLALARDRKRALEVFESARDRIFTSLARDSWSEVKNIMKEEADRLADIELKESFQNAKKVQLTGEIYVRSDEFSRQYLVQRLARRGIVTRVAPNNEWLYYVDYLLQNNLGNNQVSWLQKFKNKLKGFFQRRFEKQVKNIMCRSGLCDYKLTDIEEVMESAENVISPELTGEAILTIGSTLDEIVEDVDGVIIIGPFGCMPHRVAESILSESLEEEKEKLIEDKEMKKLMDKFSSLPFLAIETDGSVFPQVIEARLEAFILQVERMNRENQLITGN